MLTSLLSAASVSLLLLFAFAGWCCGRRNPIDNVDLALADRLFDLRARTDMALADIAARIEGMLNEGSRNICGVSQEPPPETAFNEFLLQLAASLKTAIESWRRFDDQLVDVVRRHRIVDESHDERLVTAGDSSTIPPAKSQDSSQMRRPEKADFTGRHEPHRVDAVEFLANYDGGQFPVADDFEPVECFDISRDSVSFFMNKVPQRKMFIMAFTSTGAPLFVVVKVLRVVSLGRYFVDCRIERRLTPPPRFELPSCIKSTRLASNTENAGLQTCTAI